MYNTLEFTDRDGKVKELLGGSKVSTSSLVVSAQFPVRVHDVQTGVQVIAVGTWTFRQEPLRELHQHPPQMIIQYNTRLSRIYNN